MAPPALPKRPEDDDVIPLPTVQGPAVQLVQPPAETHSTTTTGLQVTEKLPTEEGAQAFADLKAAQANIAKADAKIREEKVKAAGRQADDDEEKAAIAEFYQDERARIRREGEAPIKAAAAASEKARQEVESASKITDFWEDKGTPARALSAFIVGLNVAAGGDQAYKVLRDDMADDRQKKLDRYTKSKEFYEIRKQGEAAAQAAVERKIKEITETEITRTNLFVAQAKAVASRTGIPLATAEAEKMEAQAAQDNAQKLLEVQQHFGKTVVQPKVTTTDTVNVGGANAGAPDPLQVRNLRGDIVGRASSPAEAVKLREQHAAAHELRRVAGSLKSHIEQYGEVLLPGADSAVIRERDNKIQELTGFLTSNRGTLTLQQPEWERYKGVLTPGVWESLGGGKRAKVLDDIVSSAGQNYNAKVRAQGLSTKASAPSAAPPPEDKPQSRADIMKKADELRAWLKTDEAKKDPAQAKKAQDTLRKLASQVARGQ